MKRAIQRTKRVCQPSLPISLEDLKTLPERYYQIDGENCLFYDNIDDEPQNRVMLFGRKAALKEMANSRIWFCDGTFKCVPKIVLQLYIIHYEINGHILLGCFGLMLNKSQRSYEILFQAVKDLLPENKTNGPLKLSSDFELAATNAFLTVFTNTTLQYCYFHFSQSLRRKAQASGLASIYKQKEGEGIRAQFHACLALAFVPPLHVPNIFLALRVHTDETLDDLLDYIEDYYVLGRRRGKGRQRPRYPVESWNVYDRTLEKCPRTNNSAEAWNRRWNILTGQYHPNIFVMLGKMLRELKYSSAQRDLLRLGNRPLSKNNKYKHNDERLQNLVSRFYEISEKENNEDPWKNSGLLYLSCIGHSARYILDDIY